MRHGRVFSDWKRKLIYHSCRNHLILTLLQHGHYSLKNRITYIHHPFNISSSVHTSTYKQNIHYLIGRKLVVGKACHLLTTYTMHREYKRLLYVCLYLESQWRGILCISLLTYWRIRNRSLSYLCGTFPLTQCQKHLLIFKDLCSFTNFIMQKLGRENFKGSHVEPSLAFFLRCFFFNLSAYYTGPNFWQDSTLMN